MIDAMTLFKKYLPDKPVRHIRMRTRQHPQYIVCPCNTPSMPGPCPYISTEWFTPSGARKVIRWNHNEGRYEPDPDDH